MAIVIDQMEAQMSEAPRPAATAAPATPATPERDTVMRPLRLAAERRARLAAD